MKHLKNSLILLAVTFTIILTVMVINFNSESGIHGYTLNRGYEQVSGEVNISFDGGVLFSFNDNTTTHISLFAIPGFLYTLAFNDSDEVFDVSCVNGYGLSQLANNFKPTYISFIVFLVMVLLVGLFNLGFYLFK